MSLFHPVNLVCPSCSELVTMEAVGSVNADRRPDFRDAILADAFQDITCESCGHGFRLQPEFNYLDVGRGQWIAGLPAAQMPDHLQVEDEVGELFETSYGARAPVAAQSVGEGLEVRITFGWPALREKLLVSEHDLDDVVLEMLKLDLLRRLPSAPLAQGIELRLVSVMGEEFNLCWLDTSSEEPIEQMLIPRTMYDAIADNPDDWEKTRTKLLNGSFVDMQKLFMGPGRE